MVYINSGDLLHPLTPSYIPTNDCTWFAKHDYSHSLFRRVWDGHHLENKGWRGGGGTLSWMQKNVFGSAETFPYLFFSHPTECDTQTEFHGITEPCIAVSKEYTNVRRGNQLVSYPHMIMHLTKITWAIPNTQCLSPSLPRPDPEGDKSGRGSRALAWPAGALVVILPLDLDQVRAESSLGRRRPVSASFLVFFSMFFWKRFFAFRDPFWDPFWGLEATSRAVLMRSGHFHGFW